MALSGLKSQLEDSDSDSEPEFLQYKVVILGDGTVGKTSLCMSLNEAQFQSKYKQTIGLDFFVKRIELPGSVHVALQIWDIGGQSIGSKMLSTYIYGAHGVVFIYDITNYQSFLNVEEWLQVVKTTYAGSQLPYLALIGNKTDLYHMQAVKLEKHNSFAEQNSMYSYMVSAKTGDQVFSSFFRIAADLSGVILTSYDIESSQKVIKAEVVTYANEEKSAVPIKPVIVAKVEEPVKKKKKCVVF
jgi:Ras-related protein Rab-28